MTIVFVIGSIFTVNSPDDAPDINVGDGVCATALGDCTLRAAVMEADNLPGEDTIDFAISAVELDSTLHIYSAVYFRGNATIDSIFCPFVGICINGHGGSTLNFLNLYVESQTDGVLSTDNYIYVRSSQIRSAAGVPLFLNVVRSAVVRNSSIVSEGGLYHAIQMNLVPGADSIVIRNNYISSGNVCIYSGFTSALLLPPPPTPVDIRNNTMECGYGIMHTASGDSMPVLNVNSNSIYIYRRGASAIFIDGCQGCSFGWNQLLGTDTSGYFLHLKNVKNSSIRGNTNMNGSLYTDAGRYQLVILENSDSNEVVENVWAFSSLKDSTGGINLLRGSDYNRVDSNYVENVLWGGISVFDSSSHNRFYMDSLIYTGGIQLRPYWTGRYAFPFMIDTVYSGRVGAGNAFVRVYSYGIYDAMNVAGMDSTLVDSSVLATAGAWGIGLVNAGSRVFVRNSLLKGASTSSLIAGYGISLEYYYGETATAPEYTDDALFQISVENTEFQDFAYAFRVMDMDTSYIKLDTIFDDNNNSITGYTYGYYGGYFLPVLVQTLDLDCNLNTTAIDSVVIINSFGGRVNLSKIDGALALWSFHWEPYSTVFYDSLQSWHLSGPLYYDNLGIIGTTNPHTIKLYGENGNDLSYTVDVERGLVNYLDPCPSSGLPKTVDNRWLVIKIQYDPGYLPVDNREETGGFKLILGRSQIPVMDGEVVRIFSPSGRMIRSVKVEGNVKLELPSGVYLVKTLRKTYRVPVF